MKVMAVDPGEKRIGLAVSDYTGTIARPLKVIRHRSRAEDAKEILREAGTQGVERIIVGVALDSEGNVGPQARRALRLITELKGKTSIMVEAWDESGSTQKAYRGKKDDMLDARAAAFILQEYLDEAES